MNEKDDIESDLRVKEQKEKERLLPEIERMNKVIEELNEDVDQTNNRIEKQERENSDIEKRLDEMEVKKEGLKEEIDGLQQTMLKEKDEPNRLGKGNENLRKAVEHLRIDLEKLHNDIASTEKATEAEINAKKTTDAEKEQLIQQINGIQRKTKELENASKQSKGEIRETKEEILRSTGEQMQLGDSIKILQAEKKQLQERQNHYNKRVEDEKKLYKKIEHENTNL